MAKKIKGEDGNYYKVKKPFYKKVWFWVLVVVLVIGVGGALGGGDDSSASNGGTKVEKEEPKAEQVDAKASESTVENTTVESSAPSIEYYQVGDTVQVGDAEYTLTGAELTDERNEFDDSNPAQVVKISYTVKNNGTDDIPVGMDVEVYGPDDKKAEEYPNDNTMGSVASGKQMDCVQHFGINSTGDIEIHFAPIISLEDSAIFKVNVQ